MEKYGMNEQAAKEWLKKSWHNLSTAILLVEANHYTDVIAVEIHYSCEKTLKAILASNNSKIPKTHNLYDLYILSDININLSENEFLLEQISKYHIEESYPQYDRKLPSNDEIQEVLVFAEKLFENVCKLLNINKKELL